MVGYILYATRNTKKYQYLRTDNSTTIKMNMTQPLLRKMKNNKK